MSNAVIRHKRRNLGTGASIPAPAGQDQTSAAAGDAVWPTTRARRAVIYGTLAVVYAVTTAWVSWPVPIHLSDGLVGGGDATVNTWGYWWGQFALAHGMFPLVTSYQFHPLVLGSSAMTPLVSYQLFFWIPLHLAFGTEAAVNLLILTGFVLSGVGAFALIRYETGSPVAAFVD